MTTVSSTTLSSLASSTTAATKKATDTYNQFLILLTTQLQNQDPLDPMKSDEFTNQLVQFSQVEQAILSNEKLDNLLAQNSNSQVGQALGYIGKDVYFRGDTLYHTDQPQKIGYAIDGDAAASAVHIYDSTGTLIRTLPIAAGEVSGSIVWDGQDDNAVDVAEGNYTVRVDSLDNKGKAISTYTGLPGHIEGVETINGVLYLAITGDTRIEATSILSISEPDAPA